MIKHHQLGGNPNYNTFIEGIRVETGFHRDLRKYVIYVNADKGTVKHMVVYDLASRDRLNYLKNCIKFFKLINMSVTY